MNVSTVGAGNKSMVNKIGSNRKCEEARGPLAKEHHGTKFKPFFCTGQP